MKNANISRLGGFTLIELLVVVLIIGILAAMAMPQYFKAVERSRMAEAITIMDSIVKAQRRKFMQTNHYARHFQGLDVSPKGASGTRYFTKGDPQTGAGGNGFVYRWMTPTQTLLVVSLLRLACLMETPTTLHCNTAIGWAAGIRVIMSLAMDSTKPGANYVRTFAELILLLTTVAITARVRIALSPLTTNLFAFRPFTPCRNDTRQGYFLCLPTKPLFLL